MDVGRERYTHTASRILFDRLADLIPSHQEDADDQTKLPTPTKIQYLSSKPKNSQSLFHGQGGLSSDFHERSEADLCQSNFVSHQPISIERRRKPVESDSFQSDPNHQLEISFVPYKGKPEQSNRDRNNFEVRPQNRKKHRLTLHNHASSKSIRSSFDSWSKFSVR
jgi:hypothetical protein